jgi:hypothetical protein
LLGEPKSKSKKVDPAERLAAIVACSFPRAELTSLAYVISKQDKEFGALMAERPENREKTAYLASRILEGRKTSNGPYPLPSRYHVFESTPDARIALAIDQQLESRFEMEELRRWTYGEEFRKLPESFECRLPLREPSELQAPVFAKKIHELSEGFIGEIAELLMHAAIKAIETKRERIDRKLLEELNGKPPSQRRAEARGLR